MILKDHLNLEQQHSDISLKLTKKHGYPRSNPNPTSFFLSMEDWKFRIRKAGYWVLQDLFFEESRKDRTFLGNSRLLLCFFRIAQLVRYSESSRIGEKRKLVAHCKSLNTCQLQDILKWEKRIQIEGLSYWPIDRDSIPSIHTYLLVRSLGLEEIKELDSQLLRQRILFPQHLSFLPLACLKTHFGCKKETNNLHCYSKSKGYVRSY